jgi:uncharacterized delta-60 repeat protein
MRASETKLEWTDNRSARSAARRLAATMGVLLCVGLAGAGLALGASGDLDRSFSDDGVALTGFGTSGRGFGFAWAGAVQPNDRFVIAGYALRDTTSTDFGLARFRAHGKLDASFGARGTVRLDFGQPDEQATDVAVRSDGRIVAVGEVGVADRGEIGVARLLPNGDLDPSFSGDGQEVLDPFQPPAEAWSHVAVALQPDGGILLGGQTLVFGNVDNPGFVARLTPQGGLDPGFGTGGVKSIDLPGAPGSIVDSFINQLAVDARGRITAAATTFDSSADDSTRAWLVRLTPEGKYDTSFSGDGRKRLTNRFSALLSVAIAPHHRLVVAGRGGGRGGDSLLVGRLKSSGQFDRSFAGDGLEASRLRMGPRFLGGVVERVIPQTDGKIVALAAINTPDDGTNAIARFRSDGELDRRFSDDGRKIFNRGAATDAAMQSNGKILLAGVGGARADQKALAARFKNRARPFEAP